MARMLKVTRYLKTNMKVPEVTFYMPTFLSSFLPSLRLTVSHIVIHQIIITTTKRRYNPVGKEKWSFDNKNRRFSES